jgi:hypothetical protein
MITIPTPTTVRPHVPEATNERHSRKLGAVGIVLDREELSAYVRTTHPELSLHAEHPVRVDAGECLLLHSPIGEVAVIGTEGVGEAVPEDSIDIPLYVAIGWEYRLVQVPATVVQAAMTSEGADVADFIRLFGDRLDGNAYIWRRFCGA